MPSTAVALSPTELAGCRAVLEGRLNTLLGEIAGDRDKLGELQKDAQRVFDRKDQADRAVLASVDDAELARDLNEMREVRVALERLDAGHYGQCLACGEAIGHERLAVQPAAARCMACQTALERPGAWPQRQSSPSA